MFYNLRRRFRRAVARWQRATDTKIAIRIRHFAGNCPCCGSSDLVQKDILWDDLVDTWGLNVEQVAYINRQQGFRCMVCGSRLRSMALAAWLLRYLEADCPLSEFLDNSAQKISARVLEINEAGQLTQFLEKLPGHEMGAYPDLDMQDMKYADGTFDLIVHSDTLEHVPDPVKAMSECLRVLKPGGMCAFTVPVIVDRLTRSTSRSLPSYHGHSGTRSEDFRVCTEFGSDVWRLLAEAGFDNYQLFCFEYPAGLVHIGVKHGS